MNQTAIERNDPVVSGRRQHCYQQRTMQPAKGQLDILCAPTACGYDEPVQLWLGAAVMMPTVVDEYHTVEGDIDAHLWKRGG
jgi:hypothetical protein